MGRHLGIDFSLVSVDFGKQVGKQNRAKINKKWHRKNDGKKKGTMIAKKLEKVPATTSYRGGPGSRGGGRGRGKPFPEGEEGVVGSTGPLNHLSPEGWLDSLCSTYSPPICYRSQVISILCAWLIHAHTSAAASHNRTRNLLFRICFQNHKYHIWIVLQMVGLILFHRAKFLQEYPE